MNVKVWSCLVMLPFYDDRVRQALDEAGIRETFGDTRPEVNTTEPTEVSLSLVQGDNEAQAKTHVWTAIAKFGVGPTDVGPCTPGTYGDWPNACAGQRESEQAEAVQRSDQRRRPNRRTRRRS